MSLDAPTPGQIAEAHVDGDLGFRDAVYALVCCIPHGKALGYGGVASLIGRAGAARQVGYALAALPPGTEVPWWRVTRSDGSIALAGDPNRGPVQVTRLQGEGFSVQEHRFDMRAHKWIPDDG
jgi:methylated-DNA-protein-cysteine methyltransferase-like protein